MQETEFFFRKEQPRLLSFFVKKYGTYRLELIEDALQDSFLKAIKAWAYKGLPKHPSAWLFRVINNRILDIIQQQNTHLKYSQEWSQSLDWYFKDDLFSDQEITDSLLDWLFACCHPEISEEGQIILALRYLCGLGIMEISTAMLKTPKAIEKNLYRSKQTLIQLNITLTIPEGYQLYQRHQTVLRVLYLLFNEGYKASRGDKLIKYDICFEAIQLTKLLIDNPKTNSPQANALMALMCFQASRFDSRINEHHQLLTLEFQNRSGWDKELIEVGYQYLFHATSKPAISSYHLEAAISYEHCIANDFKSTNWKKISEYYLLLKAINPSPVIILNHLVVEAFVHDPGYAIKQLEKEKAMMDKLTEQQYLYAVKAYLYKCIGDIHMEAFYLQKSMDGTKNEIEKQYLSDQLQRHLN